MHTTVRLARQTRSNGVDNTNAKGSTLQAIPERQDSVGGLPALTHKYANVIPENGRLPIQEVRCQLDADGYLRKFFEDRSRRQARVITRPASAEYNPTATAHDGQISSKATQCDLIGIKVDTATHGIDNRLGLFVDLFLHEMVKFAFHDGSDLKFECFDATS